MPGQRLHRDEPDDLGVGPGELGRREVERTDPRRVLGLEPGGQARLGRSRQDLRPRLEQAHVEVGLGVPECQHRARIGAQVAHLDGPGLREDDDRLAVPHEPRRDQVRGAVGPDRRQPDDRLRLEEPAHAGSGEVGRVHGRSIASRAWGYRGHGSRTGMDIRRWPTATYTRPRSAASPTRTPETVPLMSSLVAMVQVSLRRSRAAWPIVASAGLICLLAASLLAAGPMYASAVSIAGLQRVMVDAPVSQANIEVSMRLDPADAEAADRIVTPELERALGEAGGTVLRLGRSDSFSRTGQQPSALTDLFEVGYAEGIEGHATLVAGSWPDQTSGAEAPLPVAIAESVADALGLATGARLPLEGRIQPDFRVLATVTGIFRIDDPADPFWWGDAQVLDGQLMSERFVTYGPLFTTADRFRDSAVAGGAEFTWRAQPDFESLTLDGAPGLRVRVGQVDRRLESAMAGVPVTVTTRLPDIVATAERSLLASRTGVLLLTVQFVVLAAYAALLSAALLVEHRRMDTAMLRSRGAGPVRIAGLSLVEGLLLTVPATLLAPWLAAAALRAFNVAGPLADIGLRIQPVVTGEAYLAAAAGAAVCLIALLLPALPTVRSFASVHGSVARAETRSLGTRLGLDLALLAVASLGLWQLRHYGAPLTRTVQGSLGIDPLLVATPAIGFLAGAVLALRVIPLVASMIERATARGRGLVSSLGARQLARRPLRYTRSALLLMLAMAMGVFAITYTWTWSASQRDQANFQVGADARVEPGRQVSALPPWALDRAYAAIPGLTARTPVEREALPIAASDVGGEIVGLDAVSAGSVVVLRPDLSATPITELLRPLAAERPTLEPVRLPGEPRSLLVDIELTIDALQQPEIDEVTGELEMVPVDPAVFADLPAVGALVVIRDAAGHLYRFGGEVGTLGGGRQRLDVPLGDPDPERGAVYGYPLELLAIEVPLALPEGREATEATVTVHSVATIDDATERAVPLALDRGWRTTSSVYGLPHAAVDARNAGAKLTVETGTPGLQIIRGVDRFGRGTIVTFAPAALDAVGAEPVPVVATDPYLEATGGAVGDELRVQIAGVDRRVQIVGAIRAFPTVDPAQPMLLIDYQTLGLLRFEGSDAVAPAEEWWFALDPAQRDAAMDLLRAPMLGSRSVVSLSERTQQLATDPVALGIIGVLGIGVVAAGLFAVVGFIVSAAVSARERVTEFALLRALGLSSGQLSGWLSLENATLAAISLVAGTALGLAVAWVALPFVTVTQGAVTPYPPVEVAVPWATIAAFEVIGIVALAGAVVVLAWLLRRIGMTSALRMGED
jgi:FtsX-like permease family